MILKIERRDFPIIWKVLCMIVVVAALLFATDWNGILQARKNVDGMNGIVSVKGPNDGTLASFPLSPPPSATPIVEQATAPVPTPTTSPTKVPVSTPAPTSVPTTAPTTTPTQATVQTTNTIPPTSVSIATSSVEDTQDSEPMTTADQGVLAEPQQPTSRYTYQLRGQPLTDEEQQLLVEKWGSWTLDSPRRGPTTTEDFYADYPNRDIPRANFPSEAWQLDKDYLDQWFPQSLALIQRAQEAILAEYGHNGTEPMEERATMFQVEIMDTWQDETLSDKRSSTKQGGFTTRTSWDGLVRRILHAIMTEDTFVFAMGGHSAAAGHGNHFTQSYTLQVQWILEAVFARLGVRHEARNFGMGGLGTVQNGLGAASIYGPDVDILMWDSGMTEREDSSQDLLHRQYILGGGKVPVLWSLALRTIQRLHLDAGADVGFPGEGLDGIPVASTLEQYQDMPWAAQSISCDGTLKDLCRQEEYNGTCWIHRDDYTPQTPQNGAPGGRASWHPGNRKHQIRGRVLAYTILSALKDAVTLWRDAEGYVLPDEAWHLTDHYERVRAKVTESVGPCHEALKEQRLEFACKYPVKSRTEFTPRAFPPWTNIRALLPLEQRTELGSPPPNAYQPPDVFNPHLHPPKGEIDVLNIVEQGVPFQSVLVPNYTNFYKMPTFSASPKLPLGRGLGLEAKSGDPFCDGSVTSFCSRGEGGCMLYGHNDGRNGIEFDGYSGWMVLNLPDVQYGYIAVKYHSWHSADGLQKTAGWTSINNERRLGSPSNDTKVNEHSRLLKEMPAPFCDEFHFDYAIDGNVTSLNLTEWQQRSYQVQRVVEVLTILEDPSYTGGQEREIEIAVRITGCARKKHFALTHVYWS